MAQPEGAPPPKGTVPPPRQVGGGTIWAGSRESGPVTPRAPRNGAVWNPWRDGGGPAVSGA